MILGIKINMRYTQSCFYYGSLASQYGPSRFGRRLGDCFEDGRCHLFVRRTKEWWTHLYIQISLLWEFLVVTKNGMNGLILFLQNRIHHYINYADTKNEEIYKYFSRVKTPWIDIMKSFLWLFAWPICMFREITQVLNWKKPWIFTIIIHSNSWIWILYLSFLHDHL